MVAKKTVRKTRKLKVSASSARAAKIIHSMRNFSTFRSELEMTYRQGRLNKAVLFILRKNIRASQISPSSKNARLKLITDYVQKVRR